jgi:hypothetical protein
MKHCSGECQQGRKDCPAPEACELSEHDEFPSPPVWTYLLAVLIVCVLGMSSAWLSTL